MRLKRLAHVFRDKKTSARIALILSVLSTIVGLFLAGINPLFLPLIQTLAIYPFYIFDIRHVWTKRAVNKVLLWALGATITMIVISYFMTDSISPLIIQGERYKLEMFSWIKTGVGPEGDINLFLYPKIKELAIFSLLTLVTLGFGGLFLGAILLNYMNYYVGCLLTYARPDVISVALAILMSWPIYAVIRVIGYVNLGVALTMLPESILFRHKLDKGKFYRRLKVAIVCISLDFILKATIANMIYRPVLYHVTRIP